MKLFAQIASRLEARANCEKSANWEWEQRHRNTVQDWVKDFMPSGSGIDSGTKIDLDASKPDKLVFTFGYHHMNEGGFYDGWTEHKAIVTPSLAHEYDLRITGRDRNQIKEYLYEVFNHALNQTVYHECESDGEKVKWKVKSE